MQICLRDTQSLPKNKLQNSKKKIKIIAIEIIAIKLEQSKIHIIAEKIVK